MTRREVKLLAQYDRLEAAGLRCRYKAFWCGTEKEVPPALQLELLPVSLWDAAFELVSVPEEVELMIAERPALRGEIEEGYDLRQMEKISHHERQVIEETERTFHRKRGEK